MIKYIYMNHIKNVMWMCHTLRVKRGVDRDSMQEWEKNIKFIIRHSIKYHYNHYHIIHIENHKNDRQ